MVVLGISGKKQSGKDTVGKMICAHFSKLKSERIAFADALKEEVAHACSVKVEYIEANKETFRPILQWWGTDFRRNLISQQYWLMKYLYKLNTTPADLIITPDIRFKNEADCVKEVGGFLIRVRRNESEATDKHPSETDLDTYQGFDYTIINDSPLPQLLIAVHVMIETLHKKLHI